MFSALRFGIIAAIFVSAATAEGAGKKVAGTIKSYECGDNCYLTIKSKSGREITALCAAAGCAAWNEQAAIPPKFIGRRVTVTIGTGKQYDGSGNFMGDFPAFTKVVVARKQ
jgi:hypothetical protein